MPFIASGRMDRRIILEKNTPTKSASGQETPAWSTLATVSAIKRDLRADEIFRARSQDARVTTEFRIRYRSDLKHVNRITDENGDIYDIEGIIEGPGRRHVLVISAVAKVS